MEGVEVTQFSNIYRGRRVILTGHTGFKGSWLALWLQQLGAEVTGVALAPSTVPSHWALQHLPIDEHIVDIRDADAMARIFAAVQPEILFHLAAQPLVRRSYVDPAETWSTNVVGTCNVLDACRKAGGVQAIVNITTDKCYQNNEWVWGYRETDRLGGHDPYSASKAAAELLSASYRASFFNDPAGPLLATARAGNVIGGGDWSVDRLIPDMVRAVEANGSLEIRSPRSTRPWQHVLESLSGYLLLGQHLLERKAAFADAWNFGPEAIGNRTVEDVLSRLAALWPAVRWHMTSQAQPHEAHLLSLDSTKAHRVLGWQPVWGFEEALRHTADWYRAFVESQQVLSAEQLRQYGADAAAAGVSWCTP